MFIVSCLIGIYNNVLIAWSIYYLIASMRSQVKKWKKVFAFFFNNVIYF